MPFGIPRMAFAMIHTFDFLIWIPDSSRFGDRSYKFYLHISTKLYTPEFDD